MTAHTWNFLGHVTMWVIGPPLMFLLIKGAENFANKHGADLLTIDLFSREGWRQYLIRRHARRLAQHGTAQ